MLLGRPLVRRRERHRVGQPLDLPRPQLAGQPLRAVAVRRAAEVARQQVGVEQVGELGTVDFLELGDRLEADEQVQALGAAGRGQAVQRLDLAALGDLVQHQVQPPVVRPGVGLGKGRVHHPVGEQRDQGVGQRLRQFAEPAAGLQQHPFRQGAPVGQPAGDAERRRVRAFLPGPGQVRQRPDERAQVDQDGLPGAVFLFQIGDDPLGVGVALAERFCISSSSGRRVSSMKSSKSHCPGRVRHR